MKRFIKKTLMKSLIFSLSFTLLIGLSHAFYVPGIAPREFTRGSKIGEFYLMMLAKVRVWSRDPFLEVKAVKMTSTRTQLPYEYYSLQFCLPKNGTLHYKSENLGEVLRGKLQLTRSSQVQQESRWHWYSFRWQNREHSIWSKNGWKHQL